MTANALLMQMQADFIGIDVIRAAFTESTALGAAIVAYRAVEPNKTKPIVIPNGITYAPKVTQNERELRYIQWKMAVERSLDWDKSV